MGEFFHLKKDDKHNRDHFDNWLEEKLAASSDGLNLSITDDVKSRSSRQNRLMWQMFRTAGKQQGQSAEELQLEAKLFLGAPILMAEDDGFRDLWLSQVKENFTVEMKLKLIGMMDVTSLFSTKQMMDFLESVFKRYAELGVDWTPMIINDFEVLRDG